MKKVAIIVDGQFLLHRIRDAQSSTQYPNLEDQYNFLTNLINSNDEELFRIFYYQGSPNKQTVDKPISKEKINFSESQINKYSSNLITELSNKDFVAMRLGDTFFRGWKLKNPVLEKIRKGIIKDTSKLTDDDFTPDFQQKGVDIKIGLDVAWLSNNNILDRIYMVTGDADFIPALKQARRDGIQIKLVKIGTKKINNDLLKHSDFILDLSNNDVIDKISK
ncbi:NYN domain-containing protein [Staphylococcus arlettae]|uniref:NYN domain-containing protein n=1 Tax=Staphylococcus arlettae TaxID=29378 RepID=UPI0010718129|nr:NYN domain-containing protein [Staphylococcus arlettae]MBF0737352.1 NYN domain-containing protein [Staphylococcus arlettae]TFU47770.1 NYN domain-containing protein [Staphylococcus arlettae]